MSPDPLAAPRTDVPMPATTGPLPLTEVAEALPFALMSVLERRYLSPFAVDAWRLERRADDLARPLLRQVVALGRPAQPGAWARAMPHVLSACHEPGHALMLVLTGYDGEHRLYLGGRRLPGSASRCTEDYLEAQAGAFKAFFQGLELGPTRAMTGGEMPELVRLLSRGRSLGLVSGIPSGRGGRLALDIQSVDRLVRAVGHHRYALMVVAEPLEQEEMDAAIDRCRRLRSEIHTYIRTTKTRGLSSSRTVGRTEVRGTESLSSDLPTYLSALSLFLQFAGLALPGARPLAGAFQAGAMLGYTALARQTAHASRQLSEGQGTSESWSGELLDANAEACDRLLQRHLERLQAARIGGWWRTATYVLGENEAALLAIGGAIRATAAGDQTDLDPIRLITLPGSVLRPALQAGQVWTMRPAGGDPGHPLGGAYETFGTCLNSEELAVLVNLPQQEIPGIPVRDRSDFALTVPPETPDSIRLGWVQDPTGRDLTPFHLTADALNRHVFVTGINGSGKTNTCMQILLQASEKLNVPFLVIEPAKTEYRALNAAGALAGRVRVLSIGGPAPLRLNPLRPVTGISLARHVDLLKAVFNASFPMFAGMAYVLEEALHEVYTERGWNLFDSSNPYLPKNAGPDAEGALIPTLEDVHDKVEVVLARKQYGREIHQNLGAALRSRLHSLTIGSKGLVLNTRRSLPPDLLFGQPTVIEVQELADDEEKAFVMALLFVLLYEYAEVRQHGLEPERRERLQHLTLIEEAHRLLQAPRGPASAEMGDPRGKAVAMFSDMLAEMRALGEGFLVADQIPTKLTPEILKNTNMKVVHRLVAPDDRLAAGSCLNLNERQCRDLNNLTPGLALIHDERVGEAFVLRVEPVKGVRVHLDRPSPAGIGSALAARVERGHLFRHAGCRECPAPCQFYHLLSRRSQDAEIQRARQTFFQSLLAGDAEASRSAWKAWLDHLEPHLPNEPDRKLGTAYCTVTQESYRWLVGLFSAREALSDGESPSPTARLSWEHLAAELAPFYFAWLTARDDAALGAAFVAGQGAIKRTLLSRPPRERPGCGDCPCRCEVLPFVAPHLQRLAKPAEDLVLSQQPFKMRLATLEQSVNPLIKNASRGTNADLAMDQRTTRNWAYCLVTNVSLGHASEDQRRAFLTELLG